MISFQYFFSFARFTPPVALNFILVIFFVIFSIFHVCFYSFFLIFFKKRWKGGLKTLHLQSWYISRSWRARGSIRVVSRPSSPDGVPPRPPFIKRTNAICNTRTNSAATKCLVNCGLCALQKNNYLLTRLFEKSVRCVQNSCELLIAMSYK